MLVAAPTRERRIGVGMRRAALTGIVAVLLVAGTSLPATAEPGPPLAAPATVHVSGQYRDGATLLVDPASLDWGAEPDSVAVQWLADGTVLDGATANAFVLTEAMVGREVRVRLTARVGDAAVEVLSPRRTVQPGDASERRLRQALAALLPALPGRYTVRVTELDRGERHVAIDAGRPREPASTVKLFIAWAVYSRIDGGTLRSTSRVSSGLTVQQCLRAMIEPSDNPCATELRTTIGTAALDRMLARHGYVNTHFWFSGGRTKVTSANDTALLLSRLARGTLLSKASSAAFLRLLKTQVWREAIPPGLPDGVVQASKPGTLWTPSGMIQTDAAIVWGKGSRYVLTVFGSNGATIPSITRISRLVYAELAGPVGRPFVYDRHQMVTTGALDLRTTRSRSSTLIRTLSAGTPIEVIDSDRDRYLVRVGTRTGWVDNTLLTLRHPLL